MGICHNERKKEKSKKNGESSFNKPLNDNSPVITKQDIDSK